MRQASLSRFVGFAMAMAAFSLCSDARAQSGSVKAVFEKHGLIGTFARDCSRPAGQDNMYFVNRLLDADHVQRDGMEGPTARPWFSVIDQAKETGRNEVWFSGRVTGMLAGKSYDGAPVEGTWRIEPKRVLQAEATIGGQKLIGGGRWLATGRDMPPMNKCN